MHSAMRRAFRPLPLLVLALSLGGLFVLAGRAAPRGDTSAAVPYSVIEDDMGTRARIGVPAGVDERQLRATLVKAADDHQNDAARDLMLSDYFWVEAYLVDGDKQGSAPAGKIRRYVPPKNPGARRGDWWDLVPAVAGKSDRLSTSLDEARRALR